MAKKKMTAKQRQMAFKAAAKACKGTGKNFRKCMSKELKKRLS